jgi:hypothetical protein
MGIFNKNYYRSKIVIFLVITACLASDSSQCKDFSVPLENISTRQCYTNSQIILANWVAEHPNYTISKFSCNEIKDSKKKEDA